MTASPPTIPKWKLDARKRLMVISASQIETFRLCKRKWWLLNVRDLIEPAKGSQVFGTILHSVCERYLEADDLAVYRARTAMVLDSSGLLPSMDRLRTW